MWTKEKVKPTQRRADINTLTIKGGLRQTLCQRSIGTYHLSLEPLQPSKNTTKILVASPQQKSLPTLRKVKHTLRISAHQHFLLQKQTETHQDAPMFSLLHLQMGKKSRVAMYLPGLQKDTEDIFLLEFPRLLEKDIPSASKASVDEQRWWCAATLSCSSCGYGTKKRIATIASE